MPTSDIEARWISGAVASSASALCTSPVKGSVSWSRIIYISALLCFGREEPVVSLHFRRAYFSSWYRIIFISELSCSNREGHVVSLSPRRVFCSSWRRIIYISDLACSNRQEVVVSLSPRIASNSSARTLWQREVVA